jgi:serine/threonine protein kinase
VLESSPAGVAGPLVPSEPKWLGKYELLHRIGSGGMAELFLARTTSLGGFEKFVALKRVLQRHQGNHELVELLLGEARLAATLQHPNIVQVYDVDEDNGTYFFAMEYVQGKDVREIIRAAARLGKWLPLEHIVNLIIGAAAGLHHAHEQRTADGRPLEIVHRDVSPANILISYDGTPKIVDFGIAKAATVREGNEETLKGKIPYMSPEQCRGEPLDRRSDVFSLGIVFWELSLGKRLFTGLKGQELVEHIAHSRAPAPSSIRPDFPPDLERIIMRALEPSRDRRYPRRPRAPARSRGVRARAQALDLRRPPRRVYARPLLDRDRRRSGRDPPVHHHHADRPLAAGSSDTDPDRADADDPSAARRADAHRHAVVARAQDHARGRRRPRRPPLDRRALRWR